jgi:iron only hydrogenase large subunit-like protein/uncharacterized Fe-S cluster-containing protein
VTEYLELKVTDCKHCYKCIRSCPVKAIRFSDNQAAIMQDECILCGRCFVSCPQNAKRVHDDLPKAQALMSGKRPVIASVAPSFAANYPGVAIEGVKEALIRLGFTDAEETAVGATLVKRRYDEMVFKGKQSIIISTCCHTVNMLVEKYYPDVLPHLAAVISPMQAHARMIHQRHSDAAVVFIGPCVSKKAEAARYPGDVDCVLTYDELNIWLMEKEISLPAKQVRQKQGNDGEGRARLFPTAGGILRTMRRENTDYSYISVDGMDDCIAALKDIAAGNLNNCFVEMSACNGSCIGGPTMNRAAGLVRSAAQINAYAPRADFTVTECFPDNMEKRMHFSSPPRPRFGEKAITDVLQKIGKKKPEDELNCGSCGYDTCREKAQAVLSGKANLEMCLPYLMGKARSFSDTIIHNTPNGILVLNESLEIQQINRAACHILNVKQGDDVLGRSVVCLMEPSLFFEVMEKDVPVYDHRQYLAEYDRYVDLTIIRDTAYGLIIGIMRDATEIESDRMARRHIADKTIRITDEVVDKQMRTVQEIASLLGETVAETKIALTNLKETLRND